jgi:hypothetical protein
MQVARLLLRQAPNQMHLRKTSCLGLGIFLVALLVLALPGCGEDAKSDPDAVGSAGHAGASAGSAGASAGSAGASVGPAGAGTGGTTGSGNGGRAGESRGGNATGGGPSPGSACRSDDDCPSPGRSLYCAEAGASQGCGACPTPDGPACTADLDCRTNGGAMICVHPCGGICPMGSCVPGCTSQTVCGEGAACGATGRCAFRPCTQPSDCPTNFDCANGACGRRPCETDAECSDYCVLGRCQTALGVCALAAA